MCSHSLHSPAVQFGSKSIASSCGLHQGDLLVGTRGPQSVAPWLHGARQVLTLDDPTGRYYRCLCINCWQTVIVFISTIYFNLNQVFFQYRKQQQYILFIMRKASNCRQAGILCESRLVLSVRTCLLIFQNMPKKMKAFQLKTIRIN